MISKLKKARVIIEIEDYRQQSLSAFNLLVNKSVLKEFLGEVGEGSLKLLIEKIKDDLLALETKLEEQL